MQPPDGLGGMASEICRQGRPIFRSTLRKLAFAEELPVVTSGSAPNRKVATMAEILPSVRFENDDPRPVGFVDAVDEAHLAAIDAALCDVADAVNEVTEGHEPKLRVRFSSVRYMPGLPFVLYGFHVPRIGDDGEFVDEVRASDEITYALVANHAIEVQRETAVLFLYDLLFRQEALAPIMKPSAAPVAIDQVVAGAESQSHLEFADRIRSGWRNAALAVAKRALASGLPLSARYVLPNRADVVRRMHVWRQVYNNVGLAREFIDKSVSMIGGRDPRISAPGLTFEQEDKLQRHLASLGVRQRISQTQRDAEVCGNGYLVMASGPQPAMYNLRPEEVEIIGPDDFRIVRDGHTSRPEGHVLHLSGIEQFRSAYGISSLEPLMGSYRGQKTLSEAKAFAERMLAERPEDSPEAKWARSTLDLADRTIASTEEHIGTLLAYPRDWLDAAREGLYFPGQERM
jgi:hypothetical protein